MAEPVQKQEAPKSELSLDEKFALVRSVGEECIEEKELRELLAKKPQPIAYDGFEPSGRMHLAQGIVKAHNVNKLTKCGVKFVFWVADWFALMNNKMGGDIKKIQTVGRYMIEVWKACGMNMENVEFLWSSEEINKHSNDYWMRVIDIASRNNLTRIVRCSQIMGRKDDNLMASQIMYPCMQCADIFFLKADICQLGMDQRKVNVLAREYCDQIGRKLKPIILSHHMLPGLLKGQEKASKSDPSSAIFMEDTEAEVNVKIKKCYCPPQELEGNPVIDYIQHVVFLAGRPFEVKRTQDNGGDKVYTSIEEVKKDYVSGALHPGDAKSGLAAAINALLQPVRDHLAKDPEAAKLCKQVRQYATQAATEKAKAEEKAKEESVAKGDQKGDGAAPLPPPGANP
jgi:tyrosyl-tRNA synthetase